MADEIITREDILNPQVLAPIVENSYQDAMVFMPLADVDRTLETNGAGDIITVPTWVGSLEAEEVKEGEDIPVGTLKQGYTQATVKKFGAGFSYTDEADLRSLASVAEKGTREISKALAQYADTELMNVALKLKDKADDDGNKPYALDTSFDVDGLWEMMDHFTNQADDGAYTLIGNPKDKTIFRRAVIDEFKQTEMATQIALSGATRLINNASFMATNKVKQGQLVVAYSSPEDIERAKELKAKLAEGTATSLELETLNSGRPFKWYAQRDVLIENERKPRNQTNYMYGTEIAAPYVQNPSKLLIVSKKA